MEDRGRARHRADGGDAREGLRKHPVGNEGGEEGSVNPTEGSDRNNYDENDTNNKNKKQRQ